jgi:hypothetical protein
VDVPGADGHGRRRWFDLDHHFDADLHHDDEHVDLDHHFDDDHHHDGPTTDDHITALAA